MPNCFNFVSMKGFEKILSFENELPVDYADRIGLLYSAFVSQNHKKNKGQFLTPSAIARFMGNMAKSDKSHLSILDPGCGTAILSWAIIESMVNSNSNLKSINLDLYETDDAIIPFISNVLDFLKRWLSSSEIFIQNYFSAAFCQNKQLYYYRLENNILNS